MQRRKGSHSKLPKISLKSVWRRSWPIRRSSSPRWMRQSLDACTPSLPPLSLITLSTRRSSKHLRSTAWSPLKTKTTSRRKTKKSSSLIQTRPRQTEDRMSGRRSALRRNEANYLSTTNPGNSVKNKNGRLSSLRKTGNSCSQLPERCANGLERHPGRKMLLRRWKTRIQWRESPRVPAHTWKMSSTRKTNDYSNLRNLAVRSTGISDMSPKLSSSLRAKMRRA